MRDGEQRVSLSPCLFPIRKPRGWCETRGVSLKLIAKPGGAGDDFRGCEQRFFSVEGAFLQLTLPKFWAAMLPRRYA
jgi:hypothetical protein